MVSRLSFSSIQHQTVSYWSSTAKGTKLWSSSWKSWAHRPEGFGHVFRLSLTASQVFPGYWWAVPGFVDFHVEVAIAHDSPSPSGDPERPANNCNSFVFSPNLSKSEDTNFVWCDLMCFFSRPVLRELWPGATLQIHHSEVLCKSWRTKPPCDWARSPVRGQRTINEHFDTTHNTHRTARSKPSKTVLLVGSIIDPDMSKMEQESLSKALFFNDAIKSHKMRQTQSINIWSWTKLFRRVVVGISIGLTPLKMGAWSASYLSSCRKA